MYDCGQHDLGYIAPMFHTKTLPQLFDYGLHLPWYTVIQAAKSYNKRNPMQGRLVFHILHAKDMGSAWVISQVGPEEVRKDAINGFDMIKQMDNYNKLKWPDDPVVDLED